MAALLSIPLVGACGDDSGAVDASTIDAQPNEGTFSLSWTLSDGNAAISCADVGAVSVAVTLIPDGGFTGESESFSCASGNGQSRGLAPGLYNVRIDLRASGSRSLLPAVIQGAQIEIVANTDTPMAAQSFVVDAQGSFSFLVDSGSAGGNCADVGAGGAGIVGISFALADALGTCIETDFVVAAGALPGGTFSSNCTTPATPLPCFGSDQLVTVASTRSGARKLTITAQKPSLVDATPSDCYSRVSDFSLAGAGLVGELGSLGLQLEYSAICDPDFVEPDAGP